MIGPFRVTSYGDDVTGLLRVTLDGSSDVIGLLRATSR